MGAGVGVSGFLADLFVVSPPDGLPVRHPSLIPSIADEETMRSIAVGERRRQGKLELRGACYKDAKFEECHTGQGRTANALHLERCMSSGPRLSKACAHGIKQWKKLLAEMWHEAHDLDVEVTSSSSLLTSGSAMPAEEADAHARGHLAARIAARNAVAASHLPPPFEFLQDNELLDLSSESYGEEQEGSGYRYAGYEEVHEPSRLRPASLVHFEPRGPRDHHPHHDHHHHGQDDSHDHGPPGRGPPPPHGKRMGPHDRPPHGPHGPHGPQGPHGPPGHHDDHGDHPRSTFSVLWDWLFEDSSDSSSSSEDSSVDSSSDSSVDSSEDRFVPKVERLADKEGMLRHKVMQSGPIVKRAQEKVTEAKAELVPMQTGYHRSFLLKGPDVDVEVADRLPFDDGEDRLTGGLKRAPSDADKKRAVWRQERERRVREREARGRGEQILAIEAQDPEPLSNTIHGRVHRSHSRAGVDLEEIHGGRHHAGRVSHHHEGQFGPGAEFHEGPHHGGPFGSDAEFPSGFQHHHGGPLREHNRPERGDHLRSRNRLPEEYENSQWFDSLDDDEGLLEIVLGFFFLIGAATLLLLPFFLLARALKSMGRRGGGRSCDGAGGAEEPSSVLGFAARRRAHAANVAAAADGYQALPEDDGEQEQGLAEEEEDDDAIVVTGAPVNPPPSVHL